MSQIPEVYAVTDDEFRSSKRSFGYKGLYSSVDFNNARDSDNKRNSMSPESIKGSPSNTRSKGFFAINDAATTRKENPIVISLNQNTD